jgi:hypothetical protein
MVATGLRKRAARKAVDALLNGRATAVARGNRVCN